MDRDSLIRKLVSPSDPKRSEVIETLLLLSMDELKEKLMMRVRRSSHRSSRSRKKIRMERPQMNLDKIRKEIEGWRN